jgi:hypothetical protein
LEQLEFEGKEEEYAIDRRRKIVYSLANGVDLAQVLPWFIQDIVMTEEKYIKLEKYFKHLRFI